MAVILKEETWGKLEVMMKEYVDGYLKTLPGIALRTEEVGHGQSKLGVDVDALKKLLNIPNFNPSRLTLNVCINNVATEKTFLVL